MPKAKKKEKAMVSASSGDGTKVLGKWAFLIGIILAILIALLGLTDTLWLSILVVIGIIVGLLNVTKNEVTPFLMSGLVLIVASALGQVSLSSLPIIIGILDALLVIIVPATIIVAIRNVWTMAKD